MTKPCSLHNFKFYRSHDCYITVLLSSTLSHGENARPKVVRFSAFHAFDDIRSGSRVKHGAGLWVHCLEHLPGTTEHTNGHRKAPTILALRRDPRLLKLPPYLSGLCVLVGVVWLLLLPLTQYSRHTYISENALLPGQVHTYFGVSEQNVFNAYKHEVQALSTSDPQEYVSNQYEVISPTCWSL